MNLAKAAAFDAEVSASWAAAPYAAEDGPKIARLLAAAEIDVGMQVLEPGCGTGRLTVALADRVGPHGRVVALDISRRMVEACRARVRGHSQVAVHHAAIEDFPLKRRAFEAAWSWRRRGSQGCLWAARRHWPRASWRPTGWCSA